MRRGVIAVGALACVATVNLFAAAARRVDVTFSKLPLRFEPNRGQFDPRVRFAARGPGYALLLMPDQALLAAQGSVLRMRFGGADNKSTIGATDPLPGRSNYYRTHVAAARSNVRSLMDATRLENVPGYASVRYANVYRGIDVIYHGNQRELEYDLVIASGADPRAMPSSSIASTR